jgi:serine/threonine protein kinase
MAPTYDPNPVDANPPSSLLSAATFLGRLRGCELLNPAELSEAEWLPAAQSADARALARELIQRGRLTPYQVNQLFQDRGAELVFGSYHLLERRGEGGTGKVFKARHRTTGAPAAVKVIRKNDRTNPDVVARFRRAVLKASRLSHRNLVRFVGAGETAEALYFVTDFVEGPDLANLVQGRGMLPAGEAAGYVRQAALGVQHAHGRGFVHRNVKPSNLILTADASGPLVKVVDVGLAHLLDGSGEAPEQVEQSSEADARVDVYGLGCTFYFLLAGRPALAGSPNLAKLRHDLPAGVSFVVEKMMNQCPEGRYQSAAEVVAALGSLFRDKSLPPPAAAGVLPVALPIAEDDTDTSGGLPLAALDRPSRGLSRRQLLALGAGGGILGIPLAAGLAYALRRQGPPETAESLARGVLPESIAPPSHEPPKEKAEPPKEKAEPPKEVKLLRKSNLQYLGAFRVPNYYDGTDEMSYSSGQIAYNSVNKSLFMTAHGPSVGEFSIPDPVKSDNLGRLNTAKTLQKWVNVARRFPTPLADASDGTNLGGIIVVDGKVIGTAYAYYSGAQKQTTSHFVLDSLKLADAKVTGLFAVRGGRAAAGCMAAVPGEWREALGCPHLTGLTGVPIISTTSAGPCAIGFDPAALKADATAPGTTFVYYPQGKELGAYTGPANPIWSGTANVTGVVFVPGTRSVLFFGRTGTNHAGYGEPGEWGDPHDGGKGPHSLNGEYAAQVWAYDANDFVAVKKGKVKSHEVVPYDVWNFTAPFGGGEWNLGGAAFDPESNRLYLPFLNVDTQAERSSLPVVQVFEVTRAAPPESGPQIGTMAATSARTKPGAVPTGTDVTLTAGNVYAINDGVTVKSVEFYRDANDNGTLEVDADKLLGKGARSAAKNADHNWQLKIETAGMAPGTYTYFARALGSNDLWGDPISTTLKIA